MLVCSPRVSRSLSQSLPGAGGADFLWMTSSGDGLRFVSFQESVVAIPSFSPLSRLLRTPARGICSSYFFSAEERTFFSGQLAENIKTTSKNICSQSRGFFLVIMSEPHSISTRANWPPNSFPQPRLVRTAMHRQKGDRKVDTAVDSSTTALSSSSQ